MKWVQFAKRLCVFLVIYISDHLCPCASYCADFTGHYACSSAYLLAITLMKKTGVKAQTLEFIFMYLFDTYIYIHITCKC